MNLIAEEHYLAELHHNIATKDLVKARILMDHLADTSPEHQDQVVSELAYCDPDFAVPLLGHLLSNPDLSISASTIHQALLEQIASAPKTLIGFLGNGQVSDKTPFIDLAGEIQAEEALPALLKLLHNTTDTSLIGTIISALKAIGSPRAIDTF